MPATGAGAFPIAERIAAEELSLPLHPHLTAEAGGGNHWLGVSGGMRADGGCGVICVRKSERRRRTADLPAGAAGHEPDRSGGAGKRTAERPRDQDHCSGGRPGSAGDLIHIATASAGGGGGGNR